jgi:hypothetical protein
MNPQSEPGNMMDDDSEPAHGELPLPKPGSALGGEEPDGIDEKPQDDNHPALTRPNTKKNGAPMTSESLSLLGAGQPYKSCC